MQKTPYNICGTSHQGNMRAGYRKNMNNAGYSKGLQQFWAYPLITTKKHGKNRCRILLWHSLSHIGLILLPHLLRQLCQGFFLSWLYNKTIFANHSPATDTLGFIAHNRIHASWIAIVMKFSNTACQLNTIPHLAIDAFYRLNNSIIF